MRILKRGDDAFVTLSTATARRFYLFRTGDGTCDVLFAGDLPATATISQMKRVVGFTTRTEAISFLRGVEFQENHPF